MGKSMQIGFMVEDLSAGQIPYLLIKNSNEAVEKDYRTNVTVFFEESYLPCFIPKFSQFHIRDAALFKGNLIATSLNTAKYLEKCFLSRRYYYLNDLDFLRKGSNSQSFDEIMMDDNVVKFTRSSDYFKELTELGYKIHPKIVEDFDIKKITEIINDG